MPAERSQSLGVRSQLSSDSSVSAGSNVAGTPYQRLLLTLQNDPRWLAEVNLGKRVGFYRFRGDLGSGNFSQVKMAVHQLTREAVAIKILDKSKLDQKTRKMLAREISVMESIHHPNIIRLYEVVETYSKIHLVMEYASGGELFNRITTEGRISEEEAKPLFAQVISAVQYMHDHNFIHRDIKAENVFYSGPGLVKLGDFGFSTQLTSGCNEQLRTFCGSPPYAAPELFRDDSYLGAPVDIWALGVLLYFVVTAQMPFKAQTVAALKQHILQGLFTPPQVSPACKTLIEGILKQPPRERLSLEKITSSEWLRDTQIPSQPGPYEHYILTPTLLPRKCSVVTLNGHVENKKKSIDVPKDSAGMAELQQKHREGTLQRSISALETSPTKLLHVQQNGTRSRHNSSELQNGAKDVEESGKENGSTTENSQKLLQEKLELEYRNLGMTDIEIKARERLDALGISATMLEEHYNLGAKSSIIGAYRILIHRIQKAKTNLENEVILIDEENATEAARSHGIRGNANNFLANLGRRKSKSATVKATKSGPKVLQRNRSKTCAIL